MLEQKSTRSFVPQEILKKLSEARGRNAVELNKKVKDLFSPLSIEECGKVLSECRKNFKKLIPLVEAAVRYKD